jgi:hypothetical protein
MAPGAASTATGMSERARDLAHQTADRAGQAIVGFIKDPSSRGVRGVPGLPGSARASLSMTIQAYRLTGFGFRIPSKTAPMWR